MSGDILIWRKLGCLSKRQVGVRPRDGKRSVPRVRKAKQGNLHVNKCSLGSGEREKKRSFYLSQKLLKEISDFSVNKELKTELANKCTIEDN